MMESPCKATCSGEYNYGVFESEFKVKKSKSKQTDVSVTFLVFYSILLSFITFFPDMPSIGGLVFVIFKTKILFQLNIFLITRSVPPSCFAKLSVFFLAY